MTATVVNFESSRRRPNISGSPARVISVTSGKGGVGKTATTVNLGLALKKLGKKVLLLDADLGLANINVVLGFETKATIWDVISGTADLEDVIVSHPLGIDVIPATSGIQEITNLSEDNKMRLLGSIDQLSSEYDYLLIDTAAGIGSNVMYFNVAAEDVFVVVDEEPTSKTDAYALIKVLGTKYGIKKFSIIANRVSIGKDGRDIYEHLSQATDKFLNVSLKFLGRISEDNSVQTAVVEQRPYLDLYPSTKASLDISNIARRVEKTPANRHPSGGMQFFFKALLEQ